METEDDNWDSMISALTSRINNGGYGVGYIRDATPPPKPAVTPLLVLENPEKLTKIKRQSMILFHIPPTEDQSDYSWRVEDVLGQKGVLKIHREITNEIHTGKKQVKFRWVGDDIGFDWVDVDRVKNPQFVLDYIESCLNGKYALPF
jgi:hypothetical protein